MGKQALAKIAITSDADVALVQALEKINQDNAGGRVTKAELASWFILQSANNLTDSAIEEVRMAHFSQVAYLEGLLKSVKRLGRDDLSQELAKFQSMVKKTTHQKKRANEVSAPDKKAPPVSIP
jgi:hypothetical protein